MSVIAFEKVTVNYDDRLVLSNISTELTESRIGIIGANGGGKSTLIRLINGLSEASTGTVTVDGIDVAKKGKEIRRKVGFVFSDADNQIVMPTVAEDLAFSLRRLKLPKSDRQKRVKDILEQFGLASHHDHSPHLLSGGQKQLLALASVMMVEPDIIIADEPTTLLDMRNRLEIKKTFARLPQQLIVVTHDLDFIRDFDRVLLIHDHRIYADGKPEDVIASYETLMQEMTA
ncbi:energy-coupling factor ABC transporter ATP-binding protein [Corynebacterium sp. ES2715-CONJ3]|uniref:energy-coupling factor ABC transporter ATP-binding protein n=1 Tax=Corynebacterium sp. ES2715-CONJ3 TaxID=2974028 RepID=UPI00216A9A27|nr:ABC transporter ATP-binding protein [Corynebacterium sp. ES2715-CONJ3]MCS4490965.1 energy-coupling factor ABC transporter ATP-binding protein [Corynebacterium sp. ES2715-CONJ3]